MRVDIRVARTHEEQAFAMRCKVFIDGEELPYCLMADEEDGSAVCLLRHNNEGRFNFDARIGSSGSELIEYTVRGQIEIRPDAAP